jgi:hypothetical protein
LLFAPVYPKRRLWRSNHALFEVRLDGTQKEFVKSIVQFSINNSVVQYRGDWHSSKKGMTTGGLGSGSIANIFVKWLFVMILLKAPEVIKYIRSVRRKR